MYSVVPVVSSSKLNFSSLVAIKLFNCLFSMQSSASKVENLSLKRKIKAKGILSNAKVYKETDKKFFIKAQ